MAFTTTTEAWAARMPVVLSVHCSSCQRPVELSCEGLAGTVMYPTYNEYFCPYCRKQNHALTSGHIVSAHPPPASA